MASTNVLGTALGLETGKLAAVSLAATFTAGPFKTRGKQLVEVRCLFAAADVVGTLAVKSGPTSSQLVTVSFNDENGDAQTSLAVTSALDGLGHEFVIPNAPSDLWLVFTSTSDGAADTLTADICARGT